MSNAQFFNRRNLFYRKNSKNELLNLRNFILRGYGNRIPKSIKNDLVNLHNIEKEDPGVTGILYGAMIYASSAYHERLSFEVLSSIFEKVFAGNPSKTEKEIAFRFISKVFSEVYRIRMKIENEEDYIVKYFVVDSLI